MAERRMFSKKIIDSDAFLDMPLSTQALYFHLSMRADDDGFVNNPKKISRMVGSSDDDAKLLMAKNFILSFESGVIVIKHWKMHNYIQKDRYHPTTYTEEKEKLSLKDNNVYTLDTECVQVVSSGKDRLGKVSIDKDSRSKKFVPPTLEQVEAYIQEKNLNVDAKHFYDFFTEGNWYDTKGNKVKSWKQKILTWNRHADSKPKQTERKFG